MKKFCLAVVDNGRVQDMLVKMPTDTATEDDLIEACDKAIKDYFADLEGNEDDE